MQERFSDTNSAYRYSYIRAPLDGGRKKSHRKFCRGRAFNFREGNRATATSKGPRKRNGSSVEIDREGETMTARDAIKFALGSWPKLIVSVLIVGQSYGARNVLSYNRCLMQNFLAFRDSPILNLPI